MVTALVRNNVHHIDAVFVTHWDEDHWGGLPAVLEQFSVGTIAVAADALEDAPAQVLNRPGVSYRQVRWGDTLDIGTFRARVMWPFDSVDGEGNEDSLVLLLTFAQEGKRLRMLLTGDAELDQEREFVQEVGDIDVLKLGHHGSKVSVDGELLGVLRPELSIASAGEGNRYGHPSDDAWMRFEWPVGALRAPSNWGISLSRRPRRALRCDANGRDDIVGARWDPGLK